MHEIEQFCRAQYESSIDAAYCKIMDTVKNGGAVVFFGDTSMVKWTLPILKDIKPKYICSLETPEKSCRYNMEVVSYKELEEENPKNTFVVITDYENFFSIKTILDKMGYMHYCMSCIYFTMPIIKSMQQIVKLWDALSDETSQVVFRGILKGRLENVFLFSEQINEDISLMVPKEYLLPNGMINNKLWFGSKYVPENYVYYDSNIVNINQYFPERQDVFLSIGEDEVFVDAGACLGETSLQFMEVTKSRFKKIYMFEPDSSHLAELNQCEHFKTNKVVIVPAGLYYENKILSFSSNENMSSHIDAEGIEKVKVVKLDDVIKEAVTFIKMDIEGAEIDAIYGAQETLRRDKPKCAISIYHNVMDLWQIPLLLKKIVPEYKIFIRQHTNFWLETVVYVSI